MTILHERILIWWGIFSTNAQLFTMRIHVQMTRPSLFDADAKWLPLKRLIVSWIIKVKYRLMAIFVCWNTEHDGLSTFLTQGWLGSIWSLQSSPIGSKTPPKWDVRLVVCDAQIRTHVGKSLDVQSNASC